MEKETRIALVGIMIEELSSSEKVNEILHDYSAYIIGRMGIPYKEKNINIISIVMDAPCDCISAISGKLGMVPSVKVKTMYSK